MRPDKKVAGIDEFQLDKMSTPHMAAERAQLRQAVSGIPTVFCS